MGCIAIVRLPRSSRSMHPLPGGDHVAAEVRMHGGGTSRLRLRHEGAGLEHRDARCRRRALVPQTQQVAGGAQGHGEQQDEGAETGRARRGSSRSGRRSGRPAGSRPAAPPPPGCRRAPRRTATAPSCAGGSRSCVSPRWAQTVRPLGCYSLVRHLRNEFAETAQARGPVSGLTSRICAPAPRRAARPRRSTR